MPQVLFHASAAADAREDPLARRLAERGVSLASSADGKADAILCRISAADSREAAEGRAVAPPEAQALAAWLFGTLTARGRRCEAGGMPVFVLCDDPKEARARLLPLLAKLQGTTHHGFGSPAFHFLAVGETGPERLAARVAQEAVEFGRRRRGQKWRILALAAGLAGALAGLAWTASLLVGVEEAFRPGSFEPPFEGARSLADLHERCERLLRFPEGVPASWQAWVSSYFRLREDAATLTAAQDIRRRLDGQATVLDRVCALGLAARPPEKPAIRWEWSPPEDAAIEERGPLLRQHAAATMAVLRKHYLPSLDRPLPFDLPEGIARELREEAAARLTEWCEPVRGLLLQSARALGGGTESPEAWRALADGWLREQAGKELADWREGAMLLARLSGRAEPADPVAELRTFLLRDSFLLPFDGVRLELPERLEVPDSPAGLRVDGPLVVRRRGKQETQTLTLPLPAGGGPSPLLRFEPGDELEATAAAVDAAGGRWRLEWRTQDAPSRVYSFSILTQSPRIAAADHPARWRLAQGVRLRFGDSRPFQLPELMPQP